ncbi:MAG: hypothetical protein ACRBBP_04070 [Bdellovibrionales bacterium]
MNNIQLSLFKRLTLLWFGLIAINIALNLPGVEDLFSSNSKVIGYSSSETCITTDVYTHKKSAGDSLLFAFLNSVAGSALNDEELSGQDVNSFTLLVDLSCAEQLSHESFYIFKSNIKLRSRAPPVA